MTKTWEEAWKSFRRSDSQSSPEYRRSIHNKPILKREELILREITDDEYSRVSDLLDDISVEDLSFDNIFQGKKRIVVPFNPGPTPELNELMKFLNRNGYDLNIESGTADREVETQKGTQIRRVKIGKLLTNLINTSKKIEAEHEKRLDLNAAIRQLEIQASERAADQNLPRGSSDDWGLVHFKDLYDKREEILDEKEKIQEKIYQLSLKLENDFPRSFSSIGPNPTPWERLLKFWNEKSDFYRKNPQAVSGQEDKYSLIISRAPIDVLRMSDFEDIVSCHSPPSRARSSGMGGEYYQCAVAEAQGHGPIAYVVENSDIPDNFSWEQDEIFSDDQRGVSGLTPISRVRLRKYTFESQEGKGTIELAVPEQRVYGKRFPNILQAVKDFFLERQDDEVDAAQEVDDMEDFTRYGGSYSDTTDATLMNTFLDTDRYMGPAELDFEDEPDPEWLQNDLSAEYIERCDEINEEYRYEIEHASFDYEIEQAEEGPYVWFWGAVEYSFDNDDIVDVLPDYNGQQQLINYIRKETDASFEDIDFRDIGQRTIVTVRANSGDYPPDPDGYESFVRATVQEELDEKYYDIYRAIRKVLVAAEILKSSPFDEFFKKAVELEDMGDMFQHFDVQVDEDGITINCKEDSFIPLNYTFAIPKDALSQKVIDPKGNDTGVSLASNKIANKFKIDLQAGGFQRDFWKKVLIMMKQTAKQINLPGIEPEEDTDYLSELDLDDLGRKFILDFAQQPKMMGSNGQWIGLADFEMIIEHGDDSKEFATFIQVFKYFDKNFNKLVLLANKVFQDHVEGTEALMKSLSVREELIGEMEPYQKEMHKKHPKWKKVLIGLGGNKSTGGGPFKIKPSMKRSKSAPPAGE